MTDPRQDERIIAFATGVVLPARPLQAWQNGGDRLVQEEVDAELVARHAAVERWRGTNNPHGRCGPIKKEECKDG